MKRLIVLMLILATPLYAQLQRGKVKYADSARVAGSGGSGDTTFKWSVSGAIQVADSVRFLTTGTVVPTRSGYTVELNVDSTKIATQSDIASFITGIAWGSVTGTLSAQTDLWTKLYQIIGRPTDTTTIAPGAGKMLIMNGAGAWQLIDSANIGGGSGSASWGSITGTFNNQTDLRDTIAGRLRTNLNDGYLFVGNASNSATGVAMSGDVTITNSGTTTIGANKVTLGKMATMATSSVLGRRTAGVGDPEVVSYTNLKADLSLNSVENTALSTWAGSANITTLGTVATGTWNADTISVAKGGTGSATVAAARVRLLPSLSGNALELLRVNAGATDVEWVTPTGTGTVTNVGLTLPAEFSVTPAAITIADTFDVSWASALAGTFLSRSISGAGTPSFRVPVYADFPFLADSMGKKADTSAVLYWPDTSAVIATQYDISDLMAHGDTAALSARINLKADTASVLYWPDTANVIATAYDISLKLNTADFADSADNHSLTVETGTGDAVALVNGAGDSLKRGGTAVAVGTDSNFIPYMVTSDSMDNLAIGYGLTKTADSLYVSATLFMVPDSLGGKFFDTTRVYTAGEIQSVIWKADSNAYEMATAFAVDTTNLSTSKYTQIVFDSAARTWSSQMAIELDTTGIESHIGDSTYLFYYTAARKMGIAHIVGLTATDTVSLSNRINLKADTASVLYWPDTSAVIATQSDIADFMVHGDTAALSARINLKADSTGAATRTYVGVIAGSKADSATALYWADTSLAGGIATQADIADFMVHGDTAALSARIDLKLTAADTTALSNRINLKLTASDTTALSNRINAKVSTSDSAYNGAYMSGWRSSQIAAPYVIDSSALALYGTRWNRGWFRMTTDSVYVDSLRAVIYSKANGDTVTARVKWGTDRSAATDSLADLKIYHSTTGVVIAGGSKVIPPRAYVWVTLTEKDGSPPDVELYLEGRRKW